MFQRLPPSSARAPRTTAGSGALRRVAACTGPLAPAVALLFTLHCAPPRTGAHSGVAAGGAARRDQPYLELGEASWYGGAGDGFAGRPTASGEPFDPSELTCAHRTLPLGTRVEVENLANGHRVRLRVNDRGPFVRGRIVDVSRRAAEVLGLLGPGVAPVRLCAVDADGAPLALDPAQTADNPYTIQVAALSDPDNLRRLVRDLEARVGPVDLREVLFGDGTRVQRVRVGRYTRYEDAQHVAEQVAVLLKDRGVDPFITRQR